MNIKVRVKNREHANAVQTRLFQWGYGWCWYKNDDDLYGDLEPLHKRQKLVDFKCYPAEDFIYLLEDRGVFLISYSDDEDYFNESTAREFTLDELYSEKKGYTMKELVKIIGHDFKIIK